MSLPPLFLSRMASLLSAGEYEKFLAVYQSPLFEAVRLNHYKSHSIFSTFDQTVPWCQDGRYLSATSNLSGNHPLHHAGAFYFQEPSAMAVVEMMDIQPDDVVLDIAAAPGGKATQIASKLSQQGLLIANDVDSQRAQALMFNVERLGLTQVVVTQHDPQHLKQIIPEMFDQILIDAPCSGEGMFRQDLHARRAWSIEHVQACQYRQQLLIENAVPLLKVGGKITYSTCTFSPEENEQLIASFLSRHRDFKLIQHPLFCLFDQQTTHGIGVKLFPHLVKGEGHYVAILQHQGTATKQPNYQHRMRNPLPGLWKIFAQHTLKYPEIFTPNFILGERLFLIPLKYRYHAALHTLRAGIYLGDMDKQVFYPTHHFAHTLSPKDVKQHLDFSFNDPQLFRYLKGEELATTLEDGWVLVTVDGLSLGWGKASKNRLKNHYPKGLRLSNTRV